MFHPPEVAEAIRVGREGRLPVQVSHIKAAGRAHWGRVGDALALIDGARAEGLDVMADVYPYTASSTTIRTLLPDWVLEGGIEAMLGRLRDPATRGRIRADMATGPVLARGLEWSDIMIASAPSHPEIEGLRFDEIARSWGKDPVEAAFDVIQSEKGRGNIILFQLDETDLQQMHRGSEVSGHERPHGRRQAPSSELWHLPARARPLRA